MALTYLLPHPKTDISGKGRPASGVQDLGAIAVPLLTAGIDWLAPDQHLEVPEAHDAGFVELTGIGQCSSHDNRLSRLGKAGAGHPHLLITPALGHGSGSA